MNDNDYESLVPEEETTEDTSKSWLVTYADLVTLLLAFFVLLFSMSSVDQKIFEESFSSIQQALRGKGQKIATSRISSQESSVLVERAKLLRDIEMQQKRVYAEVKYLQTTRGMKGLITAKLDRGKISLRVPSEVLFAPGSAKLTDEGKKVVSELKKFFIKHADQNINIKGYTDDLPVSRSSRFEDNWELSAMRAVNVLRVLAQSGLDPDRMTATGLADLDPLYPNNSSKNRARNRRIEFVLEKVIN